MEKISSHKVAMVLSAVPSMLRGLAKERDTLMEKNAQLQTRLVDYERRDRVTSLAKQAQAKHLNSLGDTEDEKIASIETALQRGKSLDVIEEAVKLSSPRGEIANLVGDEIRNEGGNTQLEAYLRGEM